MNIKALRQKRADLGAEGSAIFAAAEAEGRGLTDAEAARLDAIEGEFSAIEGDIRRMEGHMDRLRLMGAVDLDANGQAATAAAAGTVNGTQTFGNLGEMLLAVRNADGRVAGRVDPRLGNISGAATGMSEGVAEDGGFLVQTDFASTLMKPMYDTGNIMSRVTRMPIGPNSSGIKMNAVDERSRANGSRWGGLQAYWLAEAALKVPSRPRFRQMHLELKKLAVLVYVTDELMQDAVALDGFIRQAVPTEIEYTCEDAILNGTGVGMPLGYLNSPATVVVPKVAGQAAGTIVSQNIWDMYYRMPARSRSTAVWLVANDAEGALNSMALPGTAGIPTYLPPGGLSAAPYATLLGRPVIPCEYCSALGTAGDIQFVDLSQYTVIDKGGIQADYSMHVRFIYDEGVYRFVFRMDGQPAWNTPITPKNGGNPQTPFLVLQSR
jgi:HK97 family phage major capsid protein